jgi:hypothetical protein
MGIEVCNMPNLLWINLYFFEMLKIWEKKKNQKMWETYIQWTST